MKITSVQNLASVVRGRRIDLGMTQTEIAVRAGVSRPWLSKVEAGKQTAEFGLIVRLVDALGLSMQIGVSEPVESDVEPASINLDAHLEEYNDR